MEGNMINVWLANKQETIKVKAGSRLYEILAQVMPEAGRADYVCAFVNHVDSDLQDPVYRDSDIEFLTLKSETAMRCYVRSLCFLLSKSVKDVFSGGHTMVKASVSNGYYCRIDIGRELTAGDIEAVRGRMRELVEADMPFIKERTHVDRAVEMFAKRGYESKVKLLTSLQRLYTYYYTLDGEPDFYYGPLVTSTGVLQTFGLVPYSDGVLLRVPQSDNPAELRPMTKQDKLLGVFREHQEWQKLIGVETIGELNHIGNDPRSINGLITVSEALQEKKICRIAEQIEQRGSVRLVLVAGPSSSGKTTFSKRLSVQLMACGIKPYAISMDDYFVDRELTPRDENGEYDYESIHALNLDRLQRDLNDLFSGKEVELPKFDFISGKSVNSGRKVSITDNMVVVMEGIHALNPMLTATIAPELKYKVYVSALTSICLDKHNYISTSDNRLLRRIVRDYKYRNYSAADTISRWPSVRAGENKWIFPYQEEADSTFNSALLFELAGLRQQALPVLEMVPESSPVYPEAYRLRSFLQYIKPISIDKLPHTSLLREFLGGSAFHY